MKPELHEYRGRQIEIRERKDTPELLIDKVPVAYGRLPDGAFFLHDYAYDWTNDLVELARRYIAYRRRVDEVRTAASSRKEA